MRFDKVGIGYALGIVVPIAGLLGYCAFAVTVLRPELLSRAFGHPLRCIEAEGRTLFIPE